MAVQFALTRPEAIEPTMFDCESPGIDFYCPTTVLLLPGEQTRIHTGIALNLPNHKCGLLMDKSSVVTQKQLKVEAGLIDTGYRGEIIVVLRNMSKEEVILKPKDAVAQMILLPAEQPHLERVDYVNTNTNRGTRGFGGENI